MNFKGRKEFEDYIASRGFKLKDDFPEDFFSEFRDYQVDLVFDKADGSFDYEFFIETEIDVPYAFFTDTTGVKGGFQLRLIKI
ncbi:MAG: hypothetical protein LRY32_05040 [Flavobacterium sp.]|nr:hypothetical protein [Flavobacterium sp.]